MSLPMARTRRRSTLSRPAPVLGIGLLLALVLVATPAAAQMQTDVAASHYFFHPRLVLANAQRIDLTEPQRRQIQGAFTESQEEYRRLRFELGNAMTLIAGIAVQHPVDADSILDQLDRVLDIERAIKRAQLLLLVRIKNTLTPDQHVLLDEIKRTATQRDNRQRPQP